MNITRSGISDHNGFFHYIGSTGVIKNITFSSPTIDLETSYDFGGNEYHAMTMMIAGVVGMGAGDDGKNRI